MKNVLIIAEAGVNHNGSLDIAKQLVDAAASAGCDVVKFQTFNTTNLVSAKAQKADYQKQNTEGSGDNSQLAMLKKLELSLADHKALIAYCKLKGIAFLSTAFDLDSIDMLKELGVNTWKIPSGEITNLPYLEKIGALKENVLLSTGMCTLEEISAAVDVLVLVGTKKEQITVLHCNTEYPTPMHDVNLNAMNSIGEALKVKVGYSDHTLGLEVPIAAVALGATVIEKHITIDRKMDGPDHAASMQPDELVGMVKAIRNIQVAMGSGIKQPSPSEKKNMAIARKSIHLAADLKAGHVISISDLAMKRPGSGISPMEYKKVLGKKLAHDKLADDLLSWSDLV